MAKLKNLSPSLRIIYDKDNAEIAIPAGAEMEVDLAPSVQKMIEKDMELADTGQKSKEILRVMTGREREAEDPLAESREAANKAREEQVLAAQKAADEAHEAQRKSFDQPLKGRSAAEKSERVKT